MYSFVKLKGKKTIIEKEEMSFDQSYDKIPPGTYSISDVGGIFQRIIAFEPTSVPDDLISFEEGVVKNTIDKIQGFFHKDVVERYENMKISHKMGCILYGPPGTGKTACAQLIMEKLVKEVNAICIVATGKKLKFIQSVIDLLRSKEHENPIVVFIDECENSFSQEEHSYLTFLDGADSYKNIIFLGCTNFLDKIPDRIKLRKSRIKHLIEVNRFPDAVYKQYIQSKLPFITNKDLCEITFKAGESNLTIDELKHVLIDWYIDNIKIDDSITDIINLKSKVKKITSNDDEDD